MKCKHKDVPAGSVFCPWCGKRIIQAEDDIKVPEPRQLKSGTWFAQVYVKGSREPVSAPTKAEYYVKARALKAGMQAAKKAAPKMPLGKAIDKYLEENKNLISPSTLNGWQSYRKTRFQAYMEQDISAINYQKMLNDEAEKASGKTVCNAYDLVRHALDYAKMDRPDVKLPKKKVPERKWLDYEQIKVFLAGIRGKPYELGAILALHGLRRSELLHLTTEDIDAEKGIITVRGASVIGEGNRLVDKEDNKTERSTRVVHIVIPRLTELLEGRSGRLITTNPTTLYGSINDVCRKHKLPEIGVHGCRHSFASLAYHLKWSEATTMREGGWKNSKVVHEIYTHLAAQDANQDIEEMRKFYREGTDQTPEKDD